MDLTPYVDHLRHELLAVAGTGGAQARDLADRLVAPLESATRLALLSALSEAMGHVSRELAPGSVVLRLDGLAPEFVVTLPGVPRGPGKSACAPAAGASGGGAPCGHIRLQFADARSFEAAAAAFGAVVHDREALAVRLPTDGGIPTLRAVLGVLDSASIEAESLTVHTSDLDDVSLPFTGGAGPEDASGPAAHDRP
ncbi:hypothetical protein [Streptomyces abikoensis]